MYVEEKKIYIYNRRGKEKNRTNDVPAETCSTKSNSSLSIPSTHRIFGRHIGTIYVTAIRFIVTITISLFPVAACFPDAVRVFETLRRAFLAVR